MKRFIGACIFLIQQSFCHAELSCVQLLASNLKVLAAVQVKLEDEQMVKAIDLLKNENKLREKVSGDPVVQETEAKTQHRSINFKHKNIENHSIGLLKQVFPDWNYKTDILVGFRDPDAHAYLMVARHRIEATGVASIGYAYNDNTTIIQDGFFLRLRDVSGQTVERLDEALKNIGKEHPFYVTQITCIQKAMALLMGPGLLTFDGINEIPLSPTQATRLFMDAEIRNAEGGVLDRDFVSTNEKFRAADLITKIYRRQFGEGFARARNIEEIATILKLSTTSIKPTAIFEKIRAGVTAENLPKSVPPQIRDLLVEAERAGLSGSDLEEFSQLAFALPPYWLSTELGPL